MADHILSIKNFAIFACYTAAPKDKFLLESLKALDDDDLRTVLTRSSSSTTQLGFLKKVLEATERPEHPEKLGPFPNWPQNMEVVINKMPYQYAFEPIIRQRMGNNSAQLIMPWPLPYMDPCGKLEIELIARAKNLQVLLPTYTYNKNDFLSNSMFYALGEFHQNYRFLTEPEKAAFQGDPKGFLTDWVPANIAWEKAEIKVTEQFIWPEDMEVVVSDEEELIHVDIDNWRMTIGVKQTIAPVVNPGLGCYACPSEHHELQAIRPLS